MKNRIRKYREAAGVTRDHLGDILGYEGRGMRIAHWEKERRECGLEEARRIVAALNKLGQPCTLEDVFPPVAPRLNRKYLPRAPRRETGQDAP